MRLSECSARVRVRLPEWWRVHMMSTGMRDVLAHAATCMRHGVERCAARGRRILEDQACHTTVRLQEDRRSVNERRREWRCAPARSRGAAMQRGGRRERMTQCTRLQEGAGDIAAGRGGISMRREQAAVELAQAVIRPRCQRPTLSPARPRLFLSNLSPRQIAAARAQKVCEAGIGDVVSNQVVASELVFVLRLQTVWNVASPAWRVYVRREGARRSVQQVVV